MLLVLGAAVAVSTFYLSVNVLDKALGGADSQAAVRQAVCLAYVDFVLERYDEGLPAEQNHTDHRPGRRAYKR